MSQTSIELTVLSRDATASKTSLTTAPPRHVVVHATPAMTAISSKTRTAAIIASTTLTTLIGSMLSGTTTVALPTMARELDIPDALLFWPLSIQALTCGCTLLISGSVADVLGARRMYLVGSVLQSGFTLGTALARTSGQIILFRGLSGVALSFCLPSAVSIITATFVGKRRDVAFAAMGGGQPLGFALGLTLGGVLTESVGWRWAFHMGVILNTAVLAIGVWGLPAAIDDERDVDGEEVAFSWRGKWQRLVNDIDWVGAIIASVCLAMLSYVLAALTGSITAISKPYSIALLAVSLTLIPAFVAWVGRQERLGKPAVVPNSLWKNREFTAICVAVFLVWGSFNAMETILTFFFQDVQGASALKTSLYFLPAPVAGLLSNILVGAVVHRISANYLAVAGCALTVIAPLVMVVAEPSSSYWSTGFLANAFNAIGADTLFTISNLLITSVFPRRTQALAGGVFNTVSQIGKSVGLAITAVLAATVTAKSAAVDKHSPEALLEGYKATWWFVFASILATILISLWGLRTVGTVGHKRE